MINEIKVGPQTNADGAQIVARGGKTGAQVVADAHGRYFEAVARGNVYTACNQSSTTFTLFGTTTATGFLLSNPSGSGKNLAILQIGYARVTAESAAIEQLVLSGAYASQTLSSLTALSTRSMLVGSNATGVGVAYSAATLSAAGVIIAPAFVPSVSATAPVNNGPMAMVDYGGSIVIAPGSWLQLAAGFTNTLAGIASMTWEEVAA